MARTKTISGCKVPVAFKGLGKVLRTWCGLVDEYSKREPGDACYWYNERTNVGVLAAAAWRTQGWAALEEYSTSKRVPFKDRKKRGSDKRHGRIDLYVTSGTQGKGYVFEGKQAWVRRGRRATNDSALRATLRSAWDDIALLDRDEADHRFALCFLILGVSAKEAARTDDIVDEFVKEARSIENDGIAWCFPAANRHLKATSGYHYPGVIAFFKSRRKAG